MSIVCNSPKFEVSNDQSSYFNIHMPGSFMPTPSDTSSGYFDINPNSSPAQTPYFDALKQSPTQTPFYDTQTPFYDTQTPFYECETPFFEQLQNQHGLNGINPSTNNSDAKFAVMTPGYPSIRKPISFQDGLARATNNTFVPKLPPIRRQTTLISPSNKKPISLPAGLAFTPVSSSLEEFSIDRVVDMINLKLSADTPASKIILLLDLRPFNLFTTERIKTSINICIPTTLLRRCSFTADKVIETLVCDSDREIFKDWTSYENIVLYDNDSTSLSDACPVFHLCKKFQTSNIKAKIGFLKGGFMAFAEKHGDLCEKTIIKNGTLPSSAKLPRWRSSINHKPGPFTCPTPIVEVAGVNPFFANIRQNLELSCGITETIPIRVPDNIDHSKLPGFIRDVIGENGETKLAEAFHEIERAEQRRLQSLMLLNGNQSTPDCPFSISAGIEKGSKNRYNNIWPYDHARVKIHECNEGDCDYVNASFVQAAGCNKRYIATQGPLPATFNDFWKVVWEQNSRIIVMLTKEREAGRVLCHNYWSENGTPCKFGSLELTFISETSPISNSEGSIDSIVIRKFSLVHKNHPEIPAREITQLHFLGWPDFGIPDSPSHILNLIESANTAQHSASMQCDSSKEIGPMIVHCSAGCGRTGAFCTIDSVLTMLNNGNLDTNKDIVQATISQFREQRLSMVQTLRQFVFCYEAVLFKVAGAI
ncbi:18155_t:CDS:2 [Dentiscutata erythropus]|uniref:protein-tyrosine-phosphatase n=1 Tax=Dentiscutata erythropus TaxID=1348616 RepID=A0A9N9NRZ4_9GLOM|nr:18155_t:CDS:2 [Dentiscutata erythropus]